MSNNVETGLNKLVSVLTQHKSIRAIGMSGGERPLPKPGEADIDLFVYCIEIPSEDERKELLMRFEGKLEQIEIGKLESGHWGQGDCCLLRGVETWLLYFTVEEAHAELNAIVDGQYLGRLDSYYYPIGRCALWKGMRVFYDPDGFLQSLKQRLNQYPPELAEAILNHHSKALEDREDLERAVHRNDVFFFHFAMDLALDHFLQALFALNNEYFPSRKRSEAYLQGFEVKPVVCERRLRQVLALGGNRETLEQSYKIWNGLVCELAS
ncbi:MAG TPA: DUF4037 domain-containing protein, partial [Anaerolineales bacterium]|nr:DUF4037 domain-containing protein [Anaerolineales bacterium]